MRGKTMLSYNSGDYESLFGKIPQNINDCSPSCIGQCTGCMCQCRCSCSGSVSFETDWSNLDKCLLVASTNDYEKLFGTITETLNAMPRCACVSCNSCTCACSCRYSNDWDDPDWFNE